MMEVVQYVYIQEAAGVALKAANDERFKCHGKFLDSGVKLAGGTKPLSVLPLRFSRPPLPPGATIRLRDDRTPYSCDLLLANVHLPMRSADDTYSEIGYDLRMDAMQDINAYFAQDAAFGNSEMRFGDAAALLFGDLNYR